MEKLALTLKVHRALRDQLVYIIWQDTCLVKSTNGVIKTISFIFSTDVSVTVVLKQQLPLLGWVKIAGHRRATPPQITLHQAHKAMYPSHNRHPKNQMDQDLMAKISLRFERI